MINVKGVVVTKYGGPDVLQYRSIDLPEPKSNEVLIKVEAASLNFADIKGRLGNYHGVKEPPFIQGLDCVGIIEAVGTGVKNLKIGQKVITFPKNGSFAEYTIAKKELTYPISNEVDSKKAAASPTVTITSYNLLKKMARIQSGESVLIHGAAGGIGTVASQLAKIFGAKMVIGTVGSDDRMEIAKKSGVDHVINYRTSSFPEIVNKLTEQKGVDIILDSYAGDMFEKSMECLARFGRIVNFGNGNGTRGGEFDTSLLHSSCRSVLGYSTGTYQKYRPEELQEAADFLINCLENNKINIPISKVFTFEQAGEAQRYLEERKSKGKVILVPKGSSS